ncbi:hypothetical protein HGRIS_007675 [Hohenbuehelia grisea]|uniref:beta-glucosidase n=1 Tax=Hohenbuehelia grisea TaxID=104357 RepID=A0ABR3J5Y1_9AGAR
MARIKGGSPAPVYDIAAAQFVSLTMLINPLAVVLVGSLAVQAQRAHISSEWAAAYRKAETAVKKLSLKEKVDLATGVGWMNGNCIGNTPPVPSINFPGLCLEDSPLGVRSTDLVSAFPAAINVASTFNRDLIRQRGAAMGAEFRGKGVHVALGPMMNLMRAPAAGRNWEGFGGDPFLSGEGAFETVTGIQSAGVQATIKSMELMLVRMMLCSTTLSKDNSRFPGTSCQVANCAESAFTKRIIYFMLDWQATHSTLSVNAGLDMTMPGDITFNSGTTYFGANLTGAVENGSVPQSRVDDIALRILAAWYLLHQDSGYPAVNFFAWNVNAPGNQHVNVQGNHKDLIRTIDAASTVLLKNEKNALPLKAPKSIAIIGNGAGPSSKGPNGYPDRGGDDGVLAQGFGSGTAEFPYLVTPLDAITARAKKDGTSISSSLSDSDLDAAAAAAAGKDVAFVFVTADSGEGYITVEGNFGDRNDLQAWHNGDTLINKVASVNKNTIVVVNSVGPIITEAWITNPNVTGLVWSGVPGQEAGNGLADVLYGSYNPSGRLPYTIAKSANDYAAQVLFTTPGPILQVPYDEGLFIDYRHFDQANIAPRFEFGFGLSYTKFEYSFLRISGSVRGRPSASGEGASVDADLHNKVITVQFSVSNVGSVAGTEIPQLYTSPPASAQSAPRNLKGFESVFLRPGERQTVTIQLSQFDLSVWDVATQQYKVHSGKTGILIGASSRDIRLTGSIDL